MNFTLKIVTPKGIYLEKEIQSLSVRTTTGQIGVLANHLPLASPLQIGEMHFQDEKGINEYAVNGGFIYVGKEETTIIANSIESQEEIDLARAQAALGRAEKRLQERSKDIDLVRAEIALKKAINRINVKGIQ